MKLLLASTLFACVAQAGGAELSPEQRCSACLYTYQAIDREVTNQTSTHKGKKLAEQKAAVRDILSTICDSPAFESIGFANGRYIQVDQESVSGDVDRAEKHAEDLTAVCKKLINQNEKKLVPPLADFRKHSRSDLSKNLCTKWTDSCSFDYSKSKKKKQKTKISKSNKCLVDAIGLTVKGEFDAALEKVDCAVVEMPEKSNGEDESDAGKEEEASDDDDEITIEEE